jgi:hypothetical protein
MNNNVGTHAGPVVRVSDYLMHYNYLATAPFNALPAVNLGTFLAAILMALPF